MPTYANPIADFPSYDTWPDRIDYARDFVAGNPRKLEIRKESFFYYRIAMTDPARLNLDSYLAGIRLRNFPLDDFDWTICTRNLGNAHFGHSDNSVQRMNTSDLRPTSSGASFIISTECVKYWELRNSTPVSIREGDVMPRQRKDPARRSLSDPSQFVLRSPRMSCTEPPPRAGYPGRRSKVAMPLGI
jgi:hypothetical protein